MYPEIPKQLENTREMKINTIHRDGADSILSSLRVVSPSALYPMGVSTEVAQNAQEQLRQADLDLIEDHVPNEPGKIAVLQINSPGTADNPTTTSEFITLSAPDPQHVYVVPDASDPLKSRISINIDTAFRLPRKRITETSSVIAHAVLQPNIKYDHQKNPITFHALTSTKGIPHESVGFTTISSLLDFGLGAGEHQQPTDAQMLAGAYIAKLHIERHYGTGRSPILSEETQEILEALDLHIHGSYAMPAYLASENPWFDIVETPHGDRIRPVDDEVLVCIVESTQYGPSLRLNIEPAATELNAYHLVLPGGGKHADEPVIEAARRELEQEQLVTLNGNTSHLSTIAASSQLLSVSHIVLSNQTAKLSDSGIIRAIDSADEQHKPHATRIPLTELDELILTGHIRDARTIAAIAMVQRTLDRQKKFRTGSF